MILNIFKNRRIKKEEIVELEILRSKQKEYNKEKLEEETKLN